jgi:hypothetical protein
MARPCPEVGGRTLKPFSRLLLGITPEQSVTVGKGTAKLVHTSAVMTLPSALSDRSIVVWAAGCTRRFSTKAVAPHTAMEAAMDLRWVFFEHSAAH